jgi:hypothetical protein
MADAIGFMVVHPVKMLERPSSWKNSRFEQSEERPNDLWVFGSFCKQPSLPLLSFSVENVQPTSVFVHCSCRLVRTN